MIGVAIALAVQGNCGKPAPGIDSATVARIERSLAGMAAPWAVQTLAHSSTANSRMLELTRDGERVTVYLTFMKSAKDAAGHLRCTLMTIQMPRYTSLKGLGDEAYVLTEAHLRLRFGRICISVDSGNESLPVERAVAERVIAAIPGSPPP